MILAWQGAPAGGAPSIAPSAALLRQGRGPPAGTGEFSLAPAGPRGSRSPTEVLGRVSDESKELRVAPPSWS